jgi:hypothetical protein
VRRVFPFSHAEKLYDVAKRIIKSKTIFCNLICIFILNKIANEQIGRFNKKQQQWSRDYSTWLVHDEWTIF